MKKSNPFQKAISFGKLSLLFAGILFLGLGIAANYSAEKLSKEKEKNKLNQMERRLDEKFASSSDEAFVFNALKPFINKIQAPVTSITELEAEFKKVTQKGIKARIITTKNGKADKIFPDNAQDKKILTDLLESLPSSGNDFIIAQRRLQQDLMRIFGPGNRLELLQYFKNYIRRYKTQSSHGLLYWNTLTNNSNILIIIDKHPNFIKRFKSNLNNTPKIYGAGINSSSSFITPLNFSVDQMKAAQLKANLESQNYCKMFNHLWFFLKSSNQEFCCTVAPISPKESHNWMSVIQWLSLAASIICLSLYFLAWHNIAPGKNLSSHLDLLSIKYRVLGLFSMATVFPIILTILIGFTSISDRKEVIENKVKAKSLKSLNQLARSYTQKYDRIISLCEDLKNSPDIEKASEKLLLKYSKKHGLPRALTRLETRNGIGETLFTTDDKEIHGTSQAMNVFSKIAIKHHAPARMGNAINRTSPGEILSESVLSTDEIGMASILRQRGKLWIFRLGTFPTTWYWDVYPNKATGTAFFYYSNQMVSVYRDQIQKILSEQPDPNKSFQAGIEFNSTFSSFKFTPELKGKDIESLHNSVITSYTTSNTIFRKIRLFNNEYWVTIKPEKNIGTYVFMNMVPISTELKALTPLKIRLAAGGILALLISLLGASLISKLIIVPINDLNNGIQAINSRNAEFRIPVRRNDEFGIVANAFNEVINDFKELEYGRIVQESLLPENPQSPGGYDLACFRASATDLAGDYHDVLHLEDKRVSIILGDVTGHGISAALAMAMAKATVDYQGLDGEKFPKTIMDKLNSLFNKELKPRHKFMTLACMALNPETHELEIENAGQSYPYFYSAETGDAEEIKIPSMPLGAMKKRRSKPVKVTMKPGDGIILYSDGIIECSNPHGKMFGYIRLMELFKGLMAENLPSARILKTMIKTLDEFRTPGPYPDDVTLVLLKRKSKVPNLKSKI
jgi:serine phosphatase RsbU (regulator of sigma subunit)